MFIKGFLLGAGLIMPIGAQNLHVIQHGAKRRGTMVVPLVCGLCDALTIMLGVMGAGTVLARSAGLLDVLTVGGAVFLFLYGLLCFRSAITGSDTTGSQAFDSIRKADRSGLGAMIATSLAVSLLNPHVYLDTLVLFGGMSAQYAMPDRYWFGVGAVCASFAWFLGLSFLAASMSSLVLKPLVWRIVNVCSGLIMWVTAFQLLRPVL